MKIKAFLSRLKQWGLKLVHLMIANSNPLNEARDENWWRYWGIIKRDP